MQPTKNPPSGGQDASHGRHFTISPATIPGELKELSQWVCWRLEEREGNPTKVPYNAESGRRARSNDPATWTTFDAAVDAYLRGGYSGIGFMFWEGDGLTGLDLDHVIDLETGEIDPRALEILERFKGTYCEISPSGTGFRIFTRGSPGRSGKNEGRGKWLEVYTHPSHRYLTVTGHHWPQSSVEVTAQQDALDWLHEKYLTKPAHSKPPTRPAPPPTLGIDDTTLIDKAMAASNGAKFRALWSGDPSAHGGDDSAADLALCSHLAFWTGKDTGRMDRLFRQSGLLRPKWDSRRGDITYGQMTIDKAITECSEVYSERRHTGGNGHDTELSTQSLAPAISSNFSDFSDFSDADWINSETALSPADPWLDPQPLRRELPPPEPFPTDALGDQIASAVREVQRIVKAPEALCGSEFLAAAALTVQPRADIVLDGRVIPLVLFFLMLGVSGERKSAIDRIALDSVAYLQKELRQKYERVLADYEIEIAAWKKSTEEANSAKQKGRDAKIEALRAVGPKPEPPINPFLTCEEPTYEGLVRALAEGYPSLGLFSDEGGRFLGGYGMNEQNKLKMAAGLSGLWDGKPISRMRGAQGESSLLYGRRVSMSLLVQPEVAAPFLSDSLLLGQGLLSRVLIAAPESTIGTRTYVTANPFDSVAVKRYLGRAADILQLPLPLVDGTRNELSPPQVRLEQKAYQRFVRFHDHIERQMVQDGPLYSIRGIGSKIAEQALRIAGVLALFNDPQATTITDQCMDAGITLAQYYLSEALRMIETTMCNPDLVLAEKCLAWGREQPDGIVPLTRLYQYGPNPVNDAATARKMMGILEAHGFAIPLPGGVEIDRKKYREAWRVRT